jgi:hypothetical protein
MAVCVSVRGFTRPICQWANHVNIGPALQTTSKGFSGQEDWRANPNESLASGRVEFISFSIGEEDGTMIALVDLTNLLAEQFRAEDGGSSVSVRT